MKTIICIWHYKNKGKTKTIKEILKLLKKRYIHKVIFHENENNGEDFQEVIKIKKKQIGIESMGDPCCGLKEKLDTMYTKHNCNLIICASRDYGKTTVEAIYKFAKENDFNIIWSSTYDTEDNVNLHDKVNSLKAKHILDVIKKLHLLKN
ncbi:MAG: hypothetical protein Ta2B_08870 [Termitinemataceae bacterium]|nr:MAG: hypothetical protein Ta2B_08870 [Termitinemataceae bacterium]